MKKTLLKILPFFIIIFSVKIANADTRVVVFTNTNKTHTLSIQVELHLDKESYAPNEKIYITKIYSTGHITCSNGSSIDRPIYMREIFESGKPNLSTYLTLNTVNTPSTNLYYNTKDNGIYYKNNKLFTIPSIDFSGFSIVPNSIKNIRILNGELKASYNTYCVIQSDGNYYNSNNQRCDYNPEFETYTYHLDNVLSYNITVDPADNGRNVEIFTPNSYITTTNNRPIQDNTYIFGTLNAPNYFTVPQNAEFGNYVAQLTINPSFTSNTPFRNPNTGLWNNSSYGYNNDNNKNSKLYSSILNIFGIKSAQALMMYIDELDEGGGISGGIGGGGGTPSPSPTCNGWYCDIQFFAVPMSEPFTVIGNNNTPPNIMLK